MSSEFYLKDISSVMLDNPNLRMSDNDGIKGDSFLGKDWFINQDMLKKFGDGKKYTFVKMNHKDSNYTHMCIEDEFYYDESWFCLDDKDIVNPEKLKNTNPVVVEIKDLEIPE